MALDLAVGAAAKLEPFVLLSKSARGRGAAKLAEDATAAPGVFVFSELLEMPNIQELSKAEHAPYFALLQLFAYGTYQDYQQRKGSLPSLTATQITKLKLLSLVSLSMTRRVLPYSVLLQSLDMPTIRELEDLIIDGIYLDLIRGKLDQKAQQFEVECAIGRDLEPGKIEELLGALKDWANTTTSVLSSLDNQLQSLASQRAAAAAHLDEHEHSLQTNLKDVHDKAKENRSGRKNIGGLSGALDDAMDVDAESHNSAQASYDASRMKKSGVRAAMEHAKPSLRKRNRGF